MLCIRAGLHSCRAKSFWNCPVSEIRNYHTLSRSKIESDGPSINERFDYLVIFFHSKLFCNFHFSQFSHIFRYGKHLFREESMDCMSLQNQHEHCFLKASFVILLFGGTRKRIASPEKAQTERIRRYQTITDNRDEQNISSREIQKDKQR